MIKILDRMSQNIPEMISIGKILSFSHSTALRDLNLQRCSHIERYKFLQHEKIVMEDNSFRWINNGCKIKCIKLDSKYIFSEGCIGMYEKIAL